MQVLVLGFYKQPFNLGDQLFTQAFQYLFPDYQFTFTDHIRPQHLKGTDAIFIGGGSLLDQNPDITPEAIKEMASIPLIYLSCGAETEISALHQQLMARARLIVIRSHHLDKVKAINPNTLYAPDLVYALHHQVQYSERRAKSILFLPNILVVPQWHEPHWKHLSYQMFKFEMAQALDKLIEDGYIIDFYPFSQVKGQDDSYAAIELMNMMRHSVNILPSKQDQLADLTALFSQYQTIITQRYHGAILAEMSNTPYLCIHHHDKLRSTNYNLGTFTSFFEVSKEKIIKAVDFLAQHTSILPLKQDIYEPLVVAVRKCLELRA